MSRCQSSTVVSRNGFTITPAALLTHTSMPPQAVDRGLRDRLVRSGIAGVASLEDHLSPGGAHLPRRSAPRPPPRHRRAFGR